jgi:hypothetical protein
LHANLLGKRREIESLAMLSHQQCKACFSLGLSLLPRAAQPVSSAAVLLRIGSAAAKCLCFTGVTSGSLRVLPVVCRFNTLFRGFDGHWECRCSRDLPPSFAMNSF